MLEKFLKQNVLRSGLNDYLNKHKYGNADTKDLWTVLSKHTNQTLEVKVINYYPHYFALKKCSRLTNFSFTVHYGHVDSSNGISRCHNQT